MKTHHIAYDDMRDAERAKTLIECGQNGWTAEYINQNHYAEMPENGVQVQATHDFDGQVLFNATFGGAFHHYARHQAERVVREIAATFGQVRHFEEVRSAQFPNLEYRAEYFKITDAWKAVEQASVQRPALKEVRHQSATFSDAVADVRPELQGHCSSKDRIPHDPGPSLQPSGSNER